VSRPTITVSIPFRDEERHLAAAVRSVLHQTFDDFELLLLDDGSTDASLAIARSFHDPRITVLADGMRRGLPARLNEIARRARADLVARMDADDVVHPTRLARQLEAMRADPTLDVVGTWAALIDEDEVPFAVAEQAELPATEARALERGLLAHATILAKRSWHLANPYDEALTRAEDRDLWCRTAATTRFGVVPEVLYVVRVSTRDAHFLRDYLVAHRQNRRIFLRHGPRAVGVPRTARLVAASAAKSAIMRVAHAAGLSSRIVRRRGRPPTDAERARIREALASSRQEP
jgi:glycosyltransferase involved in cell wall biosynthesis